ncbi:MAG: hypothetical protein ACOYKC_07465 [Anaerolineaceae bacterium]|jgi:hypothetical protein
MDSNNNLIVIGSKARSKLHRKTDCFPIPWGSIPIFQKVGTSFVFTLIDTQKRG